MSNRVSCESCPAACCSGNELLQLDSAERDFMAQGGNVLHAILPAIPGHSWSKYSGPLPENEITDPVLAEQIRKNSQNFIVDKPKKGQGIYYLADKCAYVAEDNTCSVYDKRPSVCREVKLGGYVCMAARQRSGIAEGRPTLPLSVQ